MTAIAIVIATVAACATGTRTARGPEVATDHRLTTLGSGARVVTEAMPAVRSVALGLWIGTGSRGESDDQAGLSHMLEHLLFKGTAKYGSLEIDQIFDAMGAELNAGTGKETTSVYARVIDQHVPEAFDVMADMVFRPSLTDVDPERAVILEEIAMYDDDPQEKVFDVLGEAVFGRHPLGRAIIGSAAVIADTPVRSDPRFPRRALCAGERRDRRGRRNRARAAGGACERACPECGREASRPGEHTRRPGLAPGASSARTPSSTTSVSAARGSRVTTSGALRCACSTRSSAAPPPPRLFQEVRERRGLAYAVYSFTNAYQDAGQVGLYLGTRGGEPGRRNIGRWGRASAPRR